VFEKIYNRIIGLQKSMHQSSAATFLIVST